MFSLLVVLRQPKVDGNPVIPFRRNLVKLSSFAYAGFCGYNWKGGECK